MQDDAVRNDDLFPSEGPARPPARLAAASPVVPVSRFMASARLLVERQLGLMWIGGEISGCSRAASGHLYFTLKDAHAQVRCVFFRHKAQGLAFTLREGLAVEVRATPTIYDARGEFQLAVETVRQAGLGALYERFLQLKAALAAGGLFAEARKRPLPAFPRRIGIVTSRHAAALRDVLTTLRRRFRSVPLVLYPASVQGAGAAGEIASAIRMANARAEVDVLIVCRGGGSLEDLWAFNEQIVARAVFASAIPIVSGVGHETDFTICDFVADVRAPTPTGAATLAVPECAALRRAVADLARRFARAQAHQASARAQRLDLAARRLVHPAARLARQAEATLALRNRLTRAFAHRQAVCMHRLQALDARLGLSLRAPRPQLARVTHAARALERVVRQRLALAASTLERLQDALELLNPGAVLERGYAIVTSADGAIVSDAQRVAPGDDVAVRFARGHATATVKTTEPPTLGSEQ